MSRIAPAVDCCGGGASRPHKAAARTIGAAPRRGTEIHEIPGNLLGATISSSSTFRRAWFRFAHELGILRRDTKPAAVLPAALARCEIPDPGAFFRTEKTRPLRPVARAVSFGDPGTKPASPWCHGDDTSIADGFIRDAHDRCAGSNPASTPMAAPRSRSGIVVSAPQTPHDGHRSKCHEDSERPRSGAARRTLPIVRARAARRGSKSAAPAPAGS